MSLGTVSNNALDTNGRCELERRRGTVTAKVRIAGTSEHADLWSGKGDPSHRIEG